MHVEVGVDHLSLLQESLSNVHNSMSNLWGSISDLIDAQVIEIIWKVICLIEQIWRASLKEHSLVRTPPPSNPISSIRFWLYHLYHLAHLHQTTEVGKHPFAHLHPLWQHSYTCQFVDRSLIPMCFITYAYLTGYPRWHNRCKGLTKLSKD